MEKHVAPSVAHAASSESHGPHAATCSLPQSLVMVIQIQLPPFLVPILGFSPGAIPNSSIQKPFSPFPTLLPVTAALPDHQPRPISPKSSRGGLLVPFCSHSMHPHMAQPHAGPCRNDVTESPVIMACRRKMLLGCLTPHNHWHQQHCKP